MDTQAKQKCVEAARKHLQLNPSIAGVLVAVAILEDLERSELDQLVLEAKSDPTS